MPKFKVVLKNINAGLPNAKLQDGETYEGIRRGQSEMTMERTVAREQLDGCKLHVDTGASSGYSDGTLICNAQHRKNLYGRVLLNIEQVD